MSAIFLLLTVIFALCAYKLLTRKHDVFKLRGVEYQKPVVVFGNMFDAFVWGESLESVIGILYEKFSREKLFGVFVLHRPIFVVKDVDLIKQIGNSNSFSRYSGDEFDELGDHPMNQLKLPDSDRNKEMTNGLNSIFAGSSVAKLQLKLLQCARNSLSSIQRRQRGDSIKFVMLEVFEEFVADTIASTVLNDPRNAKIDEIRRVVKFIRADLTSFSGSVKIMVNSMIPRILKVKIFRNEIHNFFNQTLNRNDYKGEGSENNNNDDDCQRDDQVYSQFLSLFSGGFEATQKLLQSCFRELCSHQDVQAELIKEIDEARSFPDLSVNSLKVLDKVIKETLRKFPPIQSFTRICNKNCSLTTHEGEVWKFVENDVIHIPIALIQNDSKIFQNPGNFNLSRPAEDEQHFLAFGINSDKCLGASFVQLQAKALIYTFLTKYFIHSYNQTSDECYEEVELKCR